MTYRFKVCLAGLHEVSYDCIGRMKGCLFPGCFRPSEHSRSLQAGWYYIIVGYIYICVSIYIYMGYIGVI